MILDSQNTFSDSQAVTATAVSTNVIDLTGGRGTPAVRMINGEPCMYLHIIATEAATAAGAATVTITLESSSALDLSASPAVHWTSVAIPKASITVGAVLARVCLPIDNYNRYLGVRYTVGTGPLTAGKFTARLAMDVDARRDYASGFSVL